MSTSFPNSWKNGCNATAIALINTGSAPAAELVAAAAALPAGDPKARPDPATFENDRAGRAGFLKWPPAERAGPAGKAVALPFPFTFREAVGCVERAPARVLALSRAAVGAPAVAAPTALEPAVVAGMVGSDAADAADAADPGYSEATALIRYSG